PWLEISEHLRAVRKLAGEKARAGSNAHRRGREALRERSTFPHQPIEMRRVHPGRAQRRDRVGALLVRDDENDIWQAHERTLSIEDDAGLLDNVLPLFKLALLKSQKLVGPLDVELVALRAQLVLEGGIVGGLRDCGGETVDDLARRSGRREQPEPC